jgi:integrase
MTRSDIPKPDNPVRDATIAPERAQEIIEYFGKYQYATDRHVLFYFLYHTGIRIGTARALDVEDWNPEESKLHVVHRPDTGTTLKNGEKGQRAINITRPDLYDALSDYIKENRQEITDEYGRKPLFPTRQGRASTQTLRLYIQHMTQPCVLSGECPHNKEPADCEARRKVRESYGCPSAVSPHPIRRSAIVDHLNKDVPKEILEKRMNVSQRVLEAHYDPRSETAKADVRRKYLDGV